VVILLAVAGFIATPPALINDAAVPALPDDLDLYIAQRERAAAAQFPLIRDTGKRIRWHERGEKTTFAIVHLHGFSATRQETAPLAERIADALGANLFETRLTGHGRMRGAMVGVTAEDWIADAAEALAIGARLGEHVVVVGTSTGATLAIAMTTHPLFDNIDTLVLISPNFSPKDSTSKWITRPGGPLLLRAAVGDTRSWQARNEGQKRYWSTSYPSAIIVEVMRLVDLANTSLPLKVDQSILTLLSPDDQVVSTQATIEALRQIDAPRKRLIEIDDVGDPSNHVLAGNILSPDNTDEVLAQTVDFVRGLQIAE
jgi:esterase/lipase